MAKIMAGACLWPDDESVFDSYTEQFISLSMQSVQMWELGSPNAVPLSMNYMDMSRSIVDMGWIAPLYYAALKCRVHRVRLQAIRLLESASHREGPWDSRIASCVARTVMKVEEGDFYGDVQTDDNFPLSSCPGLRDLSMPSLPQSYRICEVKVVLSDGPVDSVVMFYRQHPHTEDWKESHISL